MRPARIPTYEQDEAPERQIHGDDIDAGDIPGVDLAGIDRRQEQQSQLASGQYGRWREQSRGEEQEGNEIAVAIWPWDDVVG